MSETRDEMPAMQTYVRKPEPPIRAVQWHKPGDHPAVQMMPDEAPAHYFIADELGDWIDDVEASDWITETATGGLRVVPDDIFRATYQPAAAPSRDDLELEVRTCVALIAKKIREQRESGRSDAFSGCTIEMHGATGMRFLAMADRLNNPPAPAAPPRGAAEGDGDDPYGIADALGVLSRRVEGASDIAIVDVTTSDRGGEGTLSARELRDVVAAASTATRAMQAYHRQSHEIEQILGKALGYPWFRDDPKNFPDATEADGVCVGDHVAESLADEAADKIRDLQSRLAAAERPHAPTLRSQVMALAEPKDGWHDGEGTAYRPKQLAAVAGLLERLAGIASGQVYPVPSGLSEPSGLVRVEWGDRPRDDSLEIDPVTLAARIHLYDLDSGETLIGEIMPESLAEARPRVGEAWIPAVERLPELAARSGWCADVLVFNGHVVRAAVYCYESATAERLNGLRDFRLPNSMTIIAGVTHWMPFPPPPHSEAADATPV